MPYIRVGIKRGSRGRLTAARVSTKAAMYRAASRGYNRRIGNYGRYMPPAGCGPEFKFHDVDYDDTIIAAAGTVEDSINHIPQGVTEKTRVGRKAVLKSIQWDYNVFLVQQDAGALPPNPDRLRLILYQDKQCNGVTAGVTDILETADWQSFYNLVNQGRFKILMDKTHTLNYAGLASDGAGVVSASGVDRRYTRTWKINTPIEFNAATGAITEIRSNNYGVLAISANGLGGVESKFRLRFTD